MIAGRIANRLDLGGANYTVDAACASTLAALDLACKELAAGTSDVVLCGGADMHNGIHDYLMFASVHALSPTGRCARSTPPPTASPSARAWRAWCSSGWPTPSATATGSTR